MQVLAFLQTLHNLPFSFPTLPFKSNTTSLSFWIFSLSCLLSRAKDKPKLLCSFLQLLLKVAYMSSSDGLWGRFVASTVCSLTLLYTQLHCSLGHSQSPGLFYPPTNIILFWCAACYKVWHRTFFTNDSQSWPCANKRNCVLEDFTRRIWESNCQC